MGNINKNQEPIGADREIDQDYLLALADIVAGRDLNQMHLEAQHYRFQNEIKKATAIEDALVIMRRVGLAYTAQHMQRYMQNAITETQFIPIVGRPESGSVHFMLLIDAPWMKQALRIPLEFTYADIVRALMPLPRDHDTGDAFLDQKRIEEYSKQSQKRDEYYHAITAHILSALRLWQKAHDPKDGVFPENVCGD